MDQWRHLQREWGTKVQPLKKPTVATVLTHRQFMDKNKQLTLLSQNKLAFTGRNVLMALNIRKGMHKKINQARRLFWPKDLSM
jgi:hypothetical protein